MWQLFLRECRQLCNSRWDLALVTVVPLLVILFLASLLSSGSQRQLPIVVVDQDHSVLSRQIIRNLQATPALKVAYYEQSMALAQQHLKRTQAWAVVHIPERAEVNLKRGHSPNIASYYNESFLSVGSTVSSAINSAVTAAVVAQIRELALHAGLPPVNLQLPSIAITPLYNPQLSYELFLEPFAITAILHLLLSCVMVMAFGRELNQMKAWVGQQSIMLAVISKALPYILIFSMWTFLWLLWMVGIRGWQVQGSMSLIVLGIVLLYSAYAFVAAAVVLATKDINTAMSMMAIYGGSSMSFAGVTLPVNTASWFTRLWSDLLPYTAYAKLQTQQWIIGSPWHISLKQVSILLLFVLLLLSLSCRSVTKSLREPAS